MNQSSDNNFRNIGISKAAYTIAHVIDRLPEGEWEIRISKPAVKSYPWRANVVRPYIEQRILPLPQEIAELNT